MLSSFRKGARVSSRGEPVNASRVSAVFRTATRPALALFVAGGFAVATANAAEFYYQPIASLSTSYNTNVLLEPGPKRSAEGYFADASTVLGIATPVSDTTLVPRILYNYYPSQTGLDRLEGFVSLNTRYSWQRDKFTMIGYFDHRDDLNAEQPGAQYNAVTPGIGNTTPATGHINVGITRNYVDLLPSFSHYITPLNQVGVSAEYQRLSYSPSDTTSHVDYNYYLGRGFYSYTFTPRLDGTLSAFGSRYVASNIDSTSTSEGGSAQLAYNWTQVWNTTVVASYQRTRLLETNPHQYDSNSGPWAATMTTTYTGQVDSFRVDGGRTIAPSSAGGLYRTDQIRAQYTRNITQRLSFIGALRYFKDGTITGVSATNARYYLTSNINVQYMLTPTFFVQGTYSYVWQKYQVDPSGANANVVGITFGYRGLQRQR